VRKDVTQTHSSGCLLKAMLNICVFSLDLQVSCEL